MNIPAQDHASTRYARIAGALYLCIILSGLYGEFFVRASLIEMDDPIATAENILASQSLYRSGFAADMIMVLCDVALAIVLYALFKPVNNLLSLAASVFRLIQASILSVNLLTYVAAILLLTGSSYAANANHHELDSMMTLFLNLHSYGYDLGLIFFGVSNLLIGYLIIKSVFIPGWIGYGLIAAAVVYLTGSTVRFIFPEWSETIEPVYIIPLAAELSFCIWLLSRKPGNAIKV